MANSPRIRLADLGSADDACSYLALLDAYAADPMGGNRPLADGVRQRLIEDLRRHPTAMILLAFEEQQPVGFATCFLGYSTFRARPLLNLHDLAVLPACRGRGIGRALLDAVREQARELGCCKLTLEVREDNPGAARLYRRHGFSAAQVDDRPVQYYFLEQAIDGE